MGSKCTAGYEFTWCKLRRCGRAPPPQALRDMCCHMQLQRDLMPSAVASQQVQAFGKCLVSSAMCLNT